jgi:hypothetical protein
VCVCPPRSFYLPSFFPLSSLLLSLFHLSPPSPFSPFSTAC